MSETERILTTGAPRLLLHADEICFELDDERYDIKSKFDAADEFYNLAKVGKIQISSIKILDDLAGYFCDQSFILLANFCKILMRRSAKFYRRKKVADAKIQVFSFPIKTYSQLALAIALRTFQVFIVRKIFQNFRVGFNTNLLKILNLGYLPCSQVLQCTGNQESCKSTC